MLNSIKRCPVFPRHLYDSRSVWLIHHKSIFEFNDKQNQKNIDKNNIEKAPVINHTDLELIMLEEQVLRKPPFVGKDGKVKAGYY